MFVKISSPPHFDSRWARYPETPYLPYWAIFVNKVGYDTFDCETPSYEMYFEYYDTLSYVLSYTYYLEMFCEMKLYIG